MKSLARKIGNGVGWTASQVALVGLIVGIPVFFWFYLEPFYGPWRALLLPVLLFALLTAIAFSDPGDTTCTRCRRSAG
jgi:hypothetical protein